MRKVFPVLILLVSLASGGAMASPLVDAEWVKSRIGNADVAFLDVRSRGAFMHGHVPGAVNTNYGREGWRVKNGKVPGMLPKMAKLEKLIGGLGISNDKHVVILPGGYSSGEMGVATRVYWTFKVAGHDKVSILDGGMGAYMADKKAPLAKGPAKAAKAVFKATFRPEFLATAADVKAALDGGAGLIDARPNDQYLGVNKSGKVKRHGTLPGAVNLPGRWTTVDDGGRFRTAEVLRKLYGAVGAPTSGRTITFCNTGHWASLGWFVQREILGNTEARMYDGSLAEWTQTEKHPMERKIPLK